MIADEGERVIDEQMWAFLNQNPGDLVAYLVEGNRMIAGPVEVIQSGGKLTTPKPLQVTCDTVIPSIVVLLGDDVILTAPTVSRLHPGDSVTLR